MPELPEVEITCMGLQPILQKSIKDVVVRNASLRWPIPTHLKKTLPNQKEAIKTHTKTKKHEQKKPKSKSKHL
jgi:formamidopyrimidine-DNA glycosylase